MAHRKSLIFGRLLASAALGFSPGLGLALAAEAPAPHPSKPAAIVVPKGKIDFLRDVRPILSAKCFHCHGADEGTRKAKLRLDVRDEAVKDRKGTRAIVPGDSAHSELYKRIVTKDEDDIMPPTKSGHPLTAQEVQIFKKWVDQGAPYADHWAFVKPSLPPVPKVRQTSWPAGPIDHFILAQLEKESLKPAPPADRQTLLRRVSLDLTGLPPTPSEVEEFTNDRSPQAYEKAVDRLLRAPSFGERWARVWLDLARYADSAGYGSDPLRLNIWPYRDWVIDAFNRNLPYDQFSLEQLAGDLLPNPPREALVATAFHRNTMTNTEGGTDDEEFRVAAVKDRIGTTLQVWMGLTMNCAQCHSHKYDPISNTEYYRFYAMFNQSEDNDQPDERPTLPLPTPAEAAKMDRLKQQLAAAEKEVAATPAAFDKELAEWAAKEAKAIEWVPLKPVRLESLYGATLARRDDDSILASGKNPETDTYSLRLETGLKGITALRLEALPDPSLPKEGPGRSTTGRMVVSSLTAAILPAKAEGKKARFIRVELPGEARILALAEVQAISDGKNVAPAGKASQSSTDQGAEAARAIDGNTNGDFAAGKSTTHTQSEDNPWWEVDLGQERAIEEIRIWNRTDNGLGTRLVDYRVSALDANRKAAFEMRISESPSPLKRLSLLDEKAVTLANATADFSQDSFGPEKAIDTNAKTGWSTGPTNAHPHFAVFETGGMVGSTNTTTLMVTLDQLEGTNATLGRFRISATTRAKPVKIHPKNIAEAIATSPDKWSEAQKKDLAAYFRPIAPCLAKAREQRDKLKRDLDAIKPVAVPVMRELAGEKLRTSKILVKGNFLSPGDEVAPGFPQAFNPAGSFPTNRLGVAQWLFAADNPLTARVAVNRLWAQIFGVGIVETEEDFGTQGAMPSHPELLDWLALEYRNSGWNTKALLKSIVMSATYRQASKPSSAALSKDPRNRLLSHATRRRLDAEAVRDQALALSGLLSTKIGGPSVYPPQPDGLWRAAFNGQRNWATSRGDDRYRRGLYTFWRRTVPYPSMATFDAPSRENCTLRRLPTNTPLQAFVTLNDPAYVEMSQALGRRIALEGGATTRSRAAYGLLLCLGRQPTEEQVKAIVTLYEKEFSKFQTDTAAAKKMATEPIGPLPKGLSEPEQAAWAIVGNVLLNLDGVLTKG